MNTSNSAKQIITLLLVCLFVRAPLAEQAKALSIVTFAAAQQNEADEEGVTFDNLLPASSYTIYIEARNIGQQVRSFGFNELIEPLAPMMGQLPTELDALMRFVVTNSDMLSRSRLMLAAEPAKPSLPSFLIALELASPDAAQEFQAKAQDLILSLLSPSSSVKPAESKNASAPATASNPPLPFVIKRAGRVLAFSLTPFTFKSLRDENSKPITDDPNFRAAHSRFYSETLFLYYDMALSARVMKERTEVLEKQMRDINEEAQSNSSERTPPPPEPALPATPLAVNKEPLSAPVTAEPNLDEPATGAQTDSDKKPAGATAAPPSASAAASVTALSATPKSVQPANRRGKRAGEGQKSNAQTAPEPPPEPAPPVATLGNAQQEARDSSGEYFARMVQMIMGRGLMSGPWPDAVAVALTLENDSLILRALVVAPQEMPFGPIPFIPLLISGPAHASNAASYMPADTDIFISVSLDLPRLYDTALGMFSAIENSPYARREKTKEPSFESKIAAFEKANGFKIRDEIAATLGNEVALGMPARYLASTPVGRVPLSSQSPQSGLLFMISVRDKEALKSKLGPVLEAVELKSPNEKVVTEKRGDAEINSYSRVSIAFIDNYLVIGSDAATIRRALDARAKNESLIASRDFHTSMQWQPRETLAQVYVSGAILKDMFTKPKTLNGPNDEEAKQFLARFDLALEPITYLAASDVLGPLYELRVPKNLLKRVFAEIAVDDMRNRVPRNESLARSLIQMIGRAEKDYKTEHGRYGTIEDLEDIKFLLETMKKSGYKLDLTISGNRYEATATPIEYGKTGRLSFYTDQSGVVREGDHGGSPATAADKKSNSNN